MTKKKQKNNSGAFGRSVTLIVPLQCVLQIPFRHSFHSAEAHRAASRSDMDLNAWSISEINDLSPHLFQGLCSLPASIWNVHCTSWTQSCQPFILLPCIASNPHPPHLSRIHAIQRAPGPGPLWTLSPFG